MEKIFEFPLPLQRQCEQALKCEIFETEMNDCKVYSSIFFVKSHLFLILLSDIIDNC